VLYRRAEAEACWKAIKAGVLLVTGGASDLASHYGRVGGAACPGDQAVVIEAAGHMLHFEAPAELATVIEAFLSKYL
jgi:pimeloyl-ACP methyl ester carboxylesterase